MVCLFSGRIYKFIAMRVGGLSRGIEKFLLSIYLITVARGKRIFLKSGTLY